MVKATSEGMLKVGWPNFFLIFLLIALPTWFGLIGKTAEMGILIVACSIALCFLNLDKIQSFKGAGFEAQMKEAVEQAYATLESLQNLARPLLRTNIANITFAGRWDGIGPEREHQLMKEIEDLVKTLELDNDLEIKGMIKDFYNFNAVDHLNFIVEVMRRALIENDNVIKAFRAMTVRTEDYNPPELSYVKNALSELSQEQMNLLDPYLLDYAHYKKSRTYRRPEAASYADLPASFAAINSG